MSQAATRAVSAPLVRRAGLVCCLALTTALAACASTPTSGSRVAHEPVAPSAPAAASSCRYAGLVRAVAAERDLDPALIAAIAALESGWNRKARSSAGARGLMQIMPSTARRLGCGDLDDARDNLACGAVLLRRLLARYDGALDHALAAYAMGAKAPDRAFRAGEPAPRQRFIARVKVAKKAWHARGCDT